MKIYRVCAHLGHAPNWRNDLKLFNKDFSENEQFQIMRKEEVLIPGAWHEESNKLGHEVFDVIPTDNYSFINWIKSNENKIGKSKSTELLNSMNNISIMAEQIKVFRPDFVFLYAGGTYFCPYDVRQFIDNYCGFKNKWTCHWADEIPPWLNYKDLLRGYECIFVSTIGYKKMLSKMGYETFVLGNSFSDYGKKFITQPIKNENIKYDVLFIGTTGYGIAEHIPRYKILRELLKSDEINFKIISAEPDRLDFYKSKKNIFLKAQIVSFFSKIFPKTITKFLWLTLAKYQISWKKIIRKFTSLIKAIYMIQFENYKIEDIYPYYFWDEAKYFVGKKPLWLEFPEKVERKILFGINYYNEIRKSKIILNIHRSELHDYGNIRDFEVTGCGILLLTDREELMKEYMKPLEHFVPFDNFQDLIKKIKYYSNNENERQLIARKGQLNTLKNCHTRNRVKVFFETLQKIKGV